jgi:hypothetical protein
MEFQIEFGTMNGCGFQMDNQNVGTKMIDFIRKELGVNLSLDRIRNQTKGCFFDFISRISEKQAREIGLFSETWRVKVKTPRYFFTDEKFFTISLDVRKDEDTGEILLVQPFYKVNEEYLLEWWKETGYKTDFTEE